MISRSEIKSHHILQPPPFFLALKKIKNYLSDHGAMFFPECCPTVCMASALLLWYHLVGRAFLVLRLIGAQNLRSLELGLVNP